VLGHVPLHRRGTSKTYERLEDLLREAGYKETRIFTPETERSGKDDDDDATVVEDKRLSVVKDGVGAVVGFFAGLIPSVTGSKTLDPSNEHIATQITASPQEYSPPVSPLASRVPSRSAVNLAETAHHRCQYPRPEIVVHPTVTPRHHNSPASRSYPSPNNLHVPTKKDGHASLLASPHTSTNVLAPQPSRATAYLRHMASVPNMPERPKSTPVHLLHLNRPMVKLHESDSGRTFQHDKRHMDQPPPLPKSWLGMVANAVLFGGAGAHIGGPNTDTRNTRSSSTTRQGLRPSRSSLSQTSYMRSSRYNNHLPHPKRTPIPRNGSFDQKNLTLPTQPPALFAQIERGRAGRCVNEVCLTRVVCRSAPGSRAGSVVRSGPQPGSGVGLGLGLGLDGMGMEAEKGRKRVRDYEVERGRDRGRARSRAGWLGKKEKERLRVPSLARTLVEGDVWSSNSNTKRAKADESRQVAGSGLDKNKSGYYSEGEFAHGLGLGCYGERGESLYAEEDADDEDDDDEDEDEEGEVNLARMLLPPKRQNSIRSLRKHLLAWDSTGKTVNSARPSHGGAHSPSAVERRPTLLRKKSRANSVINCQEAHDRLWTGAGEEEEEEEGGEQVNDPNHQFYRIPLALGSRWKLSAEGQRNQHHRNLNDEDTESIAGFFGVGQHEPMGSGRSRNSARTGKSRLGITSVIGGGKS